MTDVPVQPVRDSSPFRCSLGSLLRPSPFLPVAVRAGFLFSLPLFFSDRTSRLPTPVDPRPPAAAKVHVGPRARSDRLLTRRRRMNETAGATLVIQIFEFIRGDPRPSSTLPSFSSASLPPLTPPFSCPSPLPRHSLLSNSVRSLAGEHERASFAISVYRCPSAFTCVFLPFSLFPPPPLSLFLSSSPRFGNNKYVLLRPTSNKRSPGIFCPKETDDTVSFMILAQERSANNKVDISPNSTTNNRQFFLCILFHYNLIVPVIAI